jgi:hypothetical protein
MRKRTVGWIALTFLIFFITTNPTGAAATADTVLHGLGVAATAFGDFLTAVMA